MTQTKPLVSVIMPAYNCETYIAKAMESVLKQSYLHWELLIADDASEDGTLEIVNSIRDSRIKKFHNSVNQGNVATRNHLFSQSSGEFITLLDADDWMAVNKIEAQLAAFEMDRELKVCFTNYYEIYINGQQNIKHHFNRNHYLAANNFENSFYSMPATIMLKREVYQEIGGLHQYFDRLFAEDKYWIYLIVERYKSLLLNSPLYYYRANPFSLTNSLDNPRKLTVVALVNELIRQRKNKGSDWLSDGNFDEALSYERELMKNRKWLGEQYRISAAHQIDLMKLHPARRLLLKAFILNPFNVSLARTLFYLLKRFIILPGFFLLTGLLSF